MNNLIDFDSLFEYLDSLSPWMRETVTDYMEHCAAHAELPGEAGRERTSGFVEETKQDFLFAVIDQREVVDRPKRKWYRPKTRLGDRTGVSRRTYKRGICFHHTGVEDGFGPHKAVVSQYRGRIDLPPDTEMSTALVLADSYAKATWTRLNQPITVQQWARAMALAGRMRGEGRAGKFNSGTPYHAIRCANSVLVLNLPLEWVTWHGGKANNDFIGFAWDALSTRETIEDDADICADVEYLVKLARDEGHPCNEFTAHCAYTNKPHDPGPEFVVKVMEPVARETKSTIDYTFKLHGARSIGDVLETLGGD